MEIMRYVSNINIMLVVLDISFLIVSFLFFNKRKCSSRVKDGFVIVYTLVNLFLFSYFNSMFQSIFTLKYLSVKGYLVVVLMTLIIFLYTFNKNVSLKWRVINYLFCGIIGVISLVNLYIVIGDKLGVYNIFDINISIILMNVSFIIFFLYLLLILWGYMGYYIYSNYFRKKDDKRKVSEIVLDGEDDEIGEADILERLVNYKIGEAFYINGIDCSIIFFDSNKENIVKNCEILCEDINAAMVNGFTLKENMMIKNIFMKLKVNSLEDIDLNNLGILNLLDVEEYKFLKKIKATY